MDTTTEFSFVLKPSEHGVGVFAVHDIAEGTYLRLFGDGDERKAILREKSSIPAEFLGYCVDRGEQVFTPKDFGQMTVGWYLNHSSNPNVAHRDYDYFAARDIKAGEEILIDYNSLEEPEETKEDYYAN